MLHLTRLEAEIGTAQIVAGSLMAAGGEIEMPSLATARAEFDDWLVSEPEQVDAERAALMTWLGVAA